VEDLHGRVAVVTGGASGIGAALAQAFHAHGMRVALLDVNQHRLDAVTSAALPGVLAIRADVRRPDDHSAAAERVVDATNLRESRRGDLPLGSGTAGRCPGAIEPEHVARAAVDAVRRSTFYVFTHPDALARVRGRVEGLLDAVPAGETAGAAASHDAVTGGA
jgi:NAD(P)-dependent dehydrogenase (short-subunit alcohol dehydrogenase family)